MKVSKGPNNLIPHSLLFKTANHLINPKKQKKTEVKLNKIIGKCRCTTPRPSELA